MYDVLEKFLTAIADKVEWQVVILDTFGIIIMLVVTKFVIVPMWKQIKKTAIAVEAISKTSAESVTKHSDLRKLTYGISNKLNTMDESCSKDHGFVIDRLDHISTVNDKNLERAESTRAAIVEKLSNIGSSVSRISEMVDINHNSYDTAHSSIINELNSVRREIASLSGIMSYTHKELK